MSLDAYHDRLLYRHLDRVAEASDEYERLCKHLESSLPSGEVHPAWDRDGGDENVPVPTRKDKPLAHYRYYLYEMGLSDSAGARDSWARSHADWLMSRSDYEYGDEP